MPQTRLPPASEQQDQSGSQRGGRGTRRRANTDGDVAQDLPEQKTATSGKGGKVPQQERKPAEGALVVSSAKVEAEAEAAAPKRDALVDNLAVNLERRLRLLEGANSYFFLMSAESSIGKALEKAGTDYAAAVTGQGGDHAFRSPELHKAIACIDQLAAELPAGANIKLQKYRLACMRLKVMVDLTELDDDSSWVRAFTVWEAYQQTGQDRKLKITLSMLGSLDIHNKLEEEVKRTDEIIARATTALAAAPNQKDAAMHRYLEIATTSPREMKIDATNAIAGIRVDIEVIIKALLIAHGAQYRPGAAPQGDMAWKISKRKGGGKKGGGGRDGKK